MTLRSHLVLLRSGLWLIVPSVILAVVLAAVLTSVLPRRFEARATLYVGQSLSASNFDYGGLLASQLLTQTYARVATTTPLLRDVVRRLGLRVSPEKLAERIETEAPVSSTLITVIARADSPPDAAVLANAVAAELVRRAPTEPADRQAQLKAIDDLEAGMESTRQELLALLGVANPTGPQQAEIDRLAERLIALQSSHDSLAAGLAFGSPSALTLVDPATVPEAPVGPSRTIIVGAAGAAALALAVAVAYALADFERRRAAAAALA